MRRSECAGEEVEPELDGDGDGQGVERDERAGSLFVPRASWDRLEGAGRREQLDAGLLFIAQTANAADAPLTGK
jgi:hypothetical protein